MKVSEIGEFGLIDLLAKMAYAAQDRGAEAWRELILGIGDDAAAWHGHSSVQLLTCDSLIQDVHFTLEITSWEELGWRALAANLSDIAAMGGLPRYAVVSLALPGDSQVEDVAALYQGMIELARKFGVALVGGDTSSAPLLIINITILGGTRDGGERMLTRSAARAGEMVAVTGYLGASAAGLEVLSQHLKLEPEATASLKKAFLKPFPRVAEGQIMVEHGVRAAIDISDGLISDLNHICRASRVGARIEVEKVPVEPAVRANFGERALKLALAGGEDYELLFTASAEVVDRVRESTTTCPVTVIGELTADKIGEISLVDDRGNPVSPPRGGWEHFTAGQGYL